MAGYSNDSDSSPSLNARPCHIPVESPPTLALAVWLNLANGM